MKQINETNINDSEVANYYGDIGISLLSSDEIIQLWDKFEKTDYFKLRNMFSGCWYGGILSKDRGLGAISIKGIGFDDIGGDSERIFYNKALYIMSFTLVPTLKFKKPLDQLFPKGKDEGTHIVEFGLYPKTEIDNSVSIHELGQLTPYKIAFVRTNHRDSEGYYIQHYNVYEYEGSYYIFDEFDLYQKFESIKWMCDYENNRLICMQTLTSDIPFSPKGRKVDFAHSFCKEFLEKHLLPDILQLVTIPKREDTKDRPTNSVFDDLRELMTMAETIKDTDDQALIYEDIIALARMYGTEMLKIKRDEKRAYATERDLLRGGIYPYYIYLKGEIEREISADKETKEIEDATNKLVLKASLINDEGVKSGILLEIDELRKSYFSELFKRNKAYQKIDFSKPFDFNNLYNGEVKLTLEPTRALLVKELMEKEAEISKRIDREIDSNDIRSEFSEFENFISGITKK